MRIDWWTLGLQTVNVVVLVWILARFLFRPIVAIVAARQAEAGKLLDAARVAKAEAENERDQAAAETARLAGTRGALATAAAAEVEAEKSASLAVAREEVDRLRAAADAEIARAHQDAARSDADRASRLAVDIAAKVLARLPAETSVAGFIGGLEAGIAALPAATRADIGTGSVRVIAARALTDSEAQACRAMLARVVGRSVDITVATDPGLIAGLELQTPHAVVRNSFRADLDRIAAELTSHGS